MRSDDGTLRGNVEKFTWDKVPEQSDINDIKMISEEDNIYGCTRMTDIQFAYFYIKYAGCVASMKKNELNWMSIQALYNRANDLSVPVMGKAGTGSVDIEQKVRVFMGIIDIGAGYKKVATKLGISRAKVKAICTVIGIEHYTATGMSDERFRTIYRNIGGGKKKMADLIGVKWFVIDRKCRELGI